MLSLILATFLIHVTGHMPTTSISGAPLPDSIVRHVVTMKMSPCPQQVLWSSRWAHPGDAFAFDVSAPDSCYVAIVVWAGVHRFTIPGLVDTEYVSRQKAIVRKAH